MEVTDSMWEAAGEKFYEKLPKDCGMSDEKYELVKSLLSNWDEMTPGDRREQSGGNHIFWAKYYFLKYEIRIVFQFLSVGNCDKCENDQGKPIHHWCPLYLGNVSFLKFFD